MKVEMIGKQFGRWNVLKENGSNSVGTIMYLCKCNCGNIRTVSGSHLRSGATVSCGCFKNEFWSKRRGRKSQYWKGGRSIRPDGYVAFYMPDHPRASSKRYVLEHIVIAEKALGKRLPQNACSHHVDHDRSNNKNNNLVVCEDLAYHNLLHKRERALKSCGNANYLWCWYCQKFDEPKYILTEKGKNSGIHYDCKKKYQKERLKVA
ncbi:HNH endonuclease [Candidatus Pacearchaeota archaeon]|nr:HNH endonuclease [Candidatus Pacearchaeota archaeon]